MASRAFVVGIPTTNVPGFPDLLADKDAIAVERLLVSRGFEVDSRVNGCSLEQFTQGLADLREATSGGDLALVYFSGHGDRVEDTSATPDEPWDTHLILSDRALPDDWFAEEFWPTVHRRLSGTRWVTFADACFSRTALFRVDKPPPIIARERTVQGASEVRRLHIGAAPDSQVALACDPVERTLSYATAAFLRALRDQPQRTYREAVHVVADEATMLLRAGCADVPAPTLFENCSDGWLGSSQAFAPLKE